MTDKVQKIREEVEMVVNRRLNLLNGDYFDLNKEADGFTNEIMDIIDSMQEEEIPPKFPLISQKKCMYTKDDFTDEDRKVLCDGCKEECKYAQKEEPVSEDLEKEIDNYVKRNGYDGLDSIEEVKYIANHFANWQKAKDKSVTKDLGEYINELSKQFPEVSFAKLSRIAVRVAKWQKEQMMAKAIDATIEEPEPLLWRVLGELEGLFVAENNLHDGDGVKVIIIKEGNL